MTVHDAARVLGISEDAVRMRVKRGKLDAEREGGRLYVLLTPEPTQDPTGRTEMIEELRDRLRYVEGQLEQERNARYRADELLARLMERGQLEAPSSPPDATESPERSSTDSGRVDVGDWGTAPQQPSQHRPWWRRVFGG
jgi:excisionase family DNA binding protein